MYVDDIKLFAKNWKKMETNTDRENLQSGYTDGIWHKKMYHANNEKRETKNDGRGGITISRKKSGYSVKIKLTNTGEYLKRTLSTKWR